MRKKWFRSKNFSHSLFLCRDESFNSKQLSYVNKTFPRILLVQRFNCNLQNIEISSFFPFVNEIVPSATDYHANK